MPSFFRAARWMRFLLVVFACCLSLANLSCAQAQTAPAAQNRALWVWDASVITQSTSRADLLEFCRARGISTIYLHLGDFLGDKKRAESDPKHVTAEALSTFLEAAHAKNLRVQALDGDPSFAKADHHDAALKRLSAALEYNRTTPAARRLDGSQWDVEPYILPEFKNAATHDAILGEYLDFVKASRDLVAADKGAANFALGFALPYWMDGEAHSIAWNGQKKPATFHVFDTLSRLPNSYITLMAYRDKADGTNGSIALVRGEMEYAAQHAPQVTVRVGQETGAVKGDPTSITFYEEGEGALENALSQINAAYKDSPVFGGVDIHHWASYQDLIRRLPRATEAGQEAAPQEAVLTVTSPQEGEATDAKINVTGKATAGLSVQLSVKPEGDIWYEGARATAGADGTWSAPARIGNDKTPAGRRFTIRAQLIGADGGVLQEVTLHVVRR